MSTVDTVLVVLAAVVAVCLVFPGSILLWAALERGRRR